MASLKEQKRHYLMMHKFMCGLVVSCVMVVIVGGWTGGVGAGWIAWRAFAVTIGLGLAWLLLFKFWSSWQFAQSTTAKQRVSQRK